jgi:hypothetical protein
MATQEQIAAWQAELTQLEAARTAILGGKQTVSVAAGDKRVEYRNGSADMQALRDRINELKLLLGQSCRRALRIGF